MPPIQPSVSSPDILDSWKEIAAYLNRDVRTVMRWEQTRGLPVHRLPGGSAVHALRSELDSWRKAGIHLIADRDRDPRPIATPERAMPSIAVLPFVNLTGDKENEYFSDGLADEIINALTRIPGLRVTARTSSFAFRDRQQDVREIGRRLGVEFLLEGSVQRADRRTRVSAQLVGAANGFHVWSERYDRELTDVFAVQDDISASIAHALKLEITSEPRKRSANLESYRSWLQGRRYRFGARTLQEMMEAGKCFSQAVALDPEFAAAHLAVGEQMLYVAILGLRPPRQAEALGRREVERALELDDRLGEAHAVLGGYRALFDFDWAGAESAFRKALACQPGSSFILRRHAGTLLAPLLRLEQAETEAREALELDPLCPESHFALALILFFRRHYDRAEASIRTTLELGGANPFVQWLAGVISGLQGRFHEAIENCEAAVRLYGRAPMLSAGLGMIYGFVHRTAEARAILAQLEEAASATYISPIYRAWVHMGLGDFDHAFQWLDRAVDARDPHILHLPVKPVYDRLRGDPRFDALMRKMGLTGIRL